MLKAKKNLPAPYMLKVGKKKTLPTLHLKRCNLGENIEPLVYYYLGVTLLENFA